MLGENQCSHRKEKRQQSLLALAAAACVPPLTQSTTARMLLLAALTYRPTRTPLRSCQLAPYMQQPQEVPAEGGEVLLVATGLAQTFDGQRYPFRDIELSLARGAKVGLVGSNGVGKSSLLKVLVGADAPERGSVKLSRDVQLAYVEQDPTLPDGALAEEFFYGSELPGFAALREFSAAAAEVEAGGGEGVAARLQRASDAMDASGAWALESEMRKLCERLNVRSLLRSEATSLSGGQRKRLALAAALLAKPDVCRSWNERPTDMRDTIAIVAPCGWRRCSCSTSRPTTSTSRASAGTGGDLL